MRSAVAVGVLICAVVLAQADDSGDEAHQWTTQSDDAEIAYDASCPETCDGDYSCDHWTDPGQGGWSCDKLQKCVKDLARQVGEVREAIRPVASGLASDVAALRGGGGGFGGAPQAGEQS